MIDDEDIPADLSTLIRVGTIVSVTLSPPRCVVRYGDPEADEDCETPPIRWLALRAGKTRKWSPPSVGEEVVLLSPDGQIGAAIALCGLLNDAAPPPFDDDREGAEFADGSKWSYDPLAHLLSIALRASGRVELASDGGIRIRGDIVLTGTLSCDGALGSTAMASGTFATETGAIVTVVNGLIANIH